MNCWISGSISNASAREYTQKKNYTPRQQHRRDGILEAARQLITERGHEGVNMRDLAQRSGVTLKTLYHQFGNKDELLFVAVEEMFRDTYEGINRAQIRKGIDRLFFVIDKVVDTTLANEAYARALTPFLRAEPRSSALTVIRKNTYRKAIDQIDSEGELVDWVNVDLLCNNLYRQIGAIYAAWQQNEIPLSQWSDIVKMEVSLTLASVTTGFTHRRVETMAKELQHTLKSD
jgi:AcrR family transcriptional regulator